MKKRRLGLYALNIMMIICVSMFLIQMLQQSYAAGDVTPGEMHFALIAPAQEIEESDVSETVEQMAERFCLDIEVHAFSTVAEQKQLLRLLSETDIDGILLWPISANDADYEEELQTLRDAEIPVVVVDRDVAQGLRDSFIGSGISSDLVVLNQSLKTLEADASFVVGNRSGSGNGQVVELLFFEKTWEGAVAIEQLSDKKLRQMVQTPPEDYQAVNYLRLEGKSAQSLNLKYALVNLFCEGDAPELFFSLDNDLSATAVSAKKSGIYNETNSIHLLCYGRRSQYQESLDNGVINGLVTSKPDVSVSIGIRYLRDICRDFWVPETMDSGIDFLTLDAA